MLQVSIVGDDRLVALLDQVFDLVGLAAKLVRDGLAQLLQRRVLGVDLPHVAVAHAQRAIDDKREICRDKRSSEGGRESKAKEDEREMKGTRSDHFRRFEQCPCPRGDVATEKRRCR